MEKFIINHSFENDEKNSCIGSIKVENIALNELDIENFICEYLLNEETIKYIFCSNNPNQTQLKRYYFRFIPPTQDIESYLNQEMTKPSFYSFFAEGLLPIIYRDIFGYNLMNAAIDINQTLIDTNTGVDACLYDENNSVFVLGEAKFYKDFDGGMDRIYNDFVSNDSFYNKLDSLFRNSINSDNLLPIILKTTNIEEFNELTIEEFLNCKLEFCGFVLHELGSKTIEEFKNESVYTKYRIYPCDLIDHIKAKYSAFDNNNISIKFYHIFVKSKKDLIKKVISKAKENANKI